MHFFLVEETSLGDESILAEEIMHRLVVKSKPILAEERKHLLVEESRNFLSGQGIAGSSSENGLQTDI